jgi:hypothetical protein
MGHGDDIRTGRHRVFALHAHLVFVTKYRHAVFTAAHLARMEEIRQGGVRRLRVRAGPALLAGKAAVVGVVLRRLGRRRTPGRAPRLHRAATPTARRDFTSGLKAAALSQNIGSLGWRSELPRPGAADRHPVPPNRSRKAARAAEMRGPYQVRARPSTSSTRAPPKPADTSSASVSPNAHGSAGSQHQLGVASGQVGGVDPRVADGLVVQHRLAPGQPEQVDGRALTWYGPRISAAEPHPRVAPDRGAAFSMSARHATLIRTCVR